MTYGAKVNLEGMYTKPHITGNGECQASSTSNVCAHADLDIIISTVRTHVRNNLSNNDMHKVCVLANILKCSERSLGMKIRKITGRGTKAYIKQYRIELAHQELMKNPLLKVEDIAYKHGFSSDDFSRSYKKRYGIPPIKTVENLLSV